MNANGIDFKTCYLSEPGVINKNKGCFVFQELDHFAFWLVIDGVEFHPGQDSIELIVDQLCTDLAASSALSRSYIRKCVNKAHSLLKNAVNGLSLKASLVLVITDYSEIIWAVSGNSRIYLIRDRQIAFRSRDQSVAQLLVESDIINEENMNSVADRDILTNYLGIEFGFSPFISNRFHLQDGDMILLCNLGFWEQLHTETFEQLLQAVPDPTEILPIFKERFLARDSMALNNYIVGLVAVRHALNCHQFRQFQFRFPFDIKQIAVIFSVLLGIGGLIAAGVATKMKFPKETQIKVVQTQPQTLTQQNTIAAYEKNGDQLVREGKYMEANSEYYKAINILNDWPDKDTEGEIRVKISISLMLKDGDAFLAKKDYENALNRYKTALNNDTPNYFQMQTENKLTIVRRLLNAQPAKQPSPVIDSNEKSVSSELPTKQGRASMSSSSNRTVHYRAKDENPVRVQRQATPVSVKPKSSPTSPTATPVKLTGKTSVKSLVSQDEPRKTIAVDKETNRTVANTNTDAKIVTKPTESSQSKDVVKLKTASPAATNNQLNNNKPKDTGAPTTESGLLVKATALIKKGDELVSKRKFRQGVSCYKKAQNIYMKINMGVKATQLDVKIETVKNKMRNSFEGSR